MMMMHRNIATVVKLTIQVNQNQSRDMMDHEPQQQQRPSQCNEQSSPYIHSMTDFKNALHCFQSILTKPSPPTPPTDPLTMTKSTSTTMTRSSVVNTKEDVKNSSHSYNDQIIETMEMEKGINNEESISLFLKWVSLYGPSKTLLHGMESLIYKSEQERKENNGHYRMDVNNNVDDDDDNKNDKYHCNLSNASNDTKDSDYNQTTIISPKLLPIGQNSLMTTPIQNQLINYVNDKNYSSSTNNSYHTMITKQRNGMGGRVRYNTIDQHTSKRSHSSRKKKRKNQHHHGFIRQMKIPVVTTYGRRKSLSNGCTPTSQSFCEEKLKEKQIKLHMGRNSNDNSNWFDGESTNSVNKIGIPKKSKMVDNSRSNSIGHDNVLLDDFVFHSQSSQP